jgi:hypothetical protein
VSQADIAALEAAFMKSADYLHGAASESRVVTPPMAASRMPASRATAPGPDKRSEAGFVGGTLAGYPEPGFSTSWTVVSHDAASNVYLVTVTSTYPAAEKMDRYVESYYVRDGGMSGEYFSLEHPDSVWTIDDPVVRLDGSAWVEDERARVERKVVFRDGSERNEILVMDSNDAGSGKKFAAFDFAGSLQYPALFYPAEDEGAHYSSVTVYEESPVSSYAFPFWSGTVNKRIVGIRYYTEHQAPDGALTSTTVLFEKSIDSLTSSGGSLLSTLQTVFIGSVHDSLAETVLRQRVEYPSDGEGGFSYEGAVKETRMETRVVNITGRKDFFLSRLNADAAELKAYDTTTIHTPAGDAAEVLAESGANAVLRQITIGGGDGTSIPTITQTVGVGDLAILYTSIANEDVTGLMPGGGTDLQIETIDPPGVYLSYSGSVGTLITATSDPEAFAASNMTARGTVECWIYIDQYVNYAGILHKGNRADFSDEAWSLQFVDNKGLIAFAIAQQTPVYAYDLVKGNSRLNGKRWYYLAATWDIDPNNDGNKSDGFIRLYVDGALKGSGKPINAPNGAADVPDAPLVIGSQITEIEGVNGYYGFKGKINGIVLSPRAKTTEELLAFFNANKGLTASW